MSERFKILYKKVLGWIFRLFMWALFINSLVKLVRRIRGWFLGTFVTLTIAHEKVKVWAIDVPLVISLRKSQTGLMNLQEKNLWAEFCLGCRQRVQSGVGNIFMLCNLELVRHVFLSTKYCRSFPSISLEVLASLIIWDCRRSGSKLCVLVKLSKFTQCLFSKVALCIRFENCLQPLILGFV